MEVRVVDLARSFKGVSGKTYRRQGLTAERFMHLELFQDEMAGRGGIETLWKGLNEVRDTLNKADFVKSAVLVSDMIEGISSLTQQKHHPALKICALFLNAEDEDITQIDDKIINDKIEDWKDIDTNCFLAFALTSIPSYEEIYNLASQSYSTEKTEKNEVQSIGE